MACVHPILFLLINPESLLIGPVQDAPLNNLVTLVQARVESNPRGNVVGSGQGSSFESKGAKLFSLKTILVQDSQLNASQPAL